MAGRPRVIGITGGIGCGKSTVARMLRELGAEVVDADHLARRVVEPGRPAYDEIVREFGREVLQADGTIDRKRLGQRVFADEAARQRLNGMTHPRIAAEIQSHISEAEARDVEIVFYEAALIVENGMHKALDGLVVVKAEEATQVRRVMQRDGLDEGEARARVAAQLPLAEKVSVADYVIATDGDVAQTRREVERVLAEIRAGGPKRRRR